MRLLALGLALLGAAQAAGPEAEMAEVLGALKQARTLAARGQAEVTVLFPPRPEPTRRAATLPTVPARPNLIAQNFTATRVGPDTVAGRAVIRYDLTPKVGQAARWSLWVDTAWNVPLAYEERSAGGALARRAAFVKVGAAPVRQNVAPPAVPAGLRAALAQALPGLRLPPGFVPSGVGRRAAGMDIVLTDGLNTLTLVLARRDVAAAPGVASRRVAGGFVWLVGNLPPGPLGAALSGITRTDQTPLNPFQVTSRRLSPTPAPPPGTFAARADSKL
ncbi:transcriptional regulator [Deinococcus multiflagellatus]|uniref:transcriptional regulator n=1 Tax=Deinococcus multiflagellatus TaxID=1656887 RepID=UPI001CCD99A7|nr:transcriptional regulator [Deinococcus multiflagellatus]MBZ9713330.1 transcriptional regulator [Deinococcus multiflagellatus]